LNIKNGIIRIRKARAITRRTVRPNRTRILIIVKPEYLQKVTLSTVHLFFFSY
jgi:intein/homing endonuclease